MKRKILFFLLSVILILLAVPVANIINAPSRDAIHLNEKSFLYNMDFVSRWTAALLYPIGISTNPKQVIIGKNDWLYLGDLYAKTISDDSRPATTRDIETGKQIGAATEAWNAYLTGKGVKVFQIMIGPNKGSIYPENMPSWAKPVLSNPTDSFFSEIGEDHYLDLRAPLLAAKDQHREALYYKTDTHWNELGAGVAFRAFAEKIEKSAPELKWLSEEVYELTRVTPRNGGDLANFLRLTTSLLDHEPLINVSSLSVKTTQTDFATKQILFQGGNPKIDIGALGKPLLVTSTGALNDKKVLWIRDSFGTLLSPLMAATFSEVLQLYRAESLAQLVDEWKPDYVFVTVVERDARTLWLAFDPPLVFVPKGQDFEVVRTATPVGINDLARGPHENEYKIKGSDAFVEFTFLNTVIRSEVHYLDIDLSCSDDASSIPMQLFWLEDGQLNYDEEHSTRLSLRTGEYLIDLHTIPKWNSISAIKRLRLDIDAVNSCTHFKLNNPSLGR